PAAARPGRRRVPLPAQVRVRDGRLPGPAAARGAGRRPRGALRPGAGAGGDRGAGGESMRLVEVARVQGSGRDGAAAGDRLLEVRGLTVTYGLGSRHPVRAVADVSVDVRRGRTLALIGESGSGKSSIARAICGWAPIESGSIRMDGHELTTAPDRPAAAGERGIQIVFQDPVSALDPRWPVWRSIAEPLMRHVPSAAQRRERA